jgi:hypothetical protein
LDCAYIYLLVEKSQARYFQGLSFINQVELYIKWIKPHAPANKVVWLLER